MAILKLMVFFGHQMRMVHLDGIIAWAKLTQMWIGVVSKKPVVIQYDVLRIRTISFNLQPLTVFPSLRRTGGQKKAKEFCGNLIATKDTKTLADCFSRKRGIAMTGNIYKEITTKNKYT
jgi:hypothetical protein